MAFRTRSSPCACIPNDPGSELQPVYERRVQEDGTLELVAVGTENIQHKIQEGVVGLTPYEILDRYARCPDPEILNQMEKSYADFTAAPRSLAELEQFRIDARNAFFSLPANVRQLYNNNFNTFMQNPQAFEEFYRGLTDQGKKESAKAAAYAAEVSKTDHGVGNAASEAPSGVKISSGG